jgi:N-acetylglutamate synthase-like GNAT family acetyltransferase
MRIVPGPIAIWQQRQKAAADKQRADALSASSGSSPGMGSGNAGLDNPFTNLGVSTGPRPRASAGAQRVIFLTDGVTVQRATPSDVPDVLWLIRRTAGSAIRTKRRDLLMTLGERGYLIGRKDGEISSLAGWSSENLVATVDLIIITPPEAAYHTGAAIMQEIEDTANSLICEVILAFPPTDPSEEMRLLFEARGYVLIDADVLPKAWRSAVEENQPHDTLIYMKILRDIRQVGPA